MSVFIDTGVFYAHQDRSATHHAAATDAMRLVAGGRWGRAFTSDHVFGETFTLTRARMRDHAQAMTVASRILGRAPFPRVVDLLMVTGPVFREALRVLETYADKSLSFADATTVALVKQRNIGHVLSFDTDFDGIVPRLDPRVVKAQERA